MIKFEYCAAQRDSTRQEPKEESAMALNHELKGRLKSFRIPRHSGFLRISERPIESSLETLWAFRGPNFALQVYCGVVRDKRLAG